MDIEQNLAPFLCTKVNKSLEDKGIFKSSAHDVRKGMSKKWSECNWWVWGVWGGRSRLHHHEAETQKRCFQKIHIVYNHSCTFLQMIRNSKAYGLTNAYRCVNALLCIGHYYIWYFLVYITMSKIPYSKVYLNISDAFLCSLCCDICW